MLACSVFSCFEHLVSFCSFHLDSSSVQWLPNVAENLSAYAHFSCFSIGDHTFVGRDDSGSQSSEYSRQIFTVCIYTKTRLRDSLKACDNFFILISTVFQGDVNRLKCPIINEIIFLNISFVYHDVCDSEIHLGWRYIYCIMFCCICIKDSC